MICPRNLKCNSKRKQRNCLALLSLIGLMLIYTGLLGKLGGNPKERSNMNEAQIIANALFSETKDYEDAKQIASVIINRTKNPDRWGSTPTDVIMQPYQFSGVGGREWTKAKTQKFTEEEANIYKKFLQIGYQITKGTFETTTEANHYFNPKIAKPKWAEKMKKLEENKYHSYYKD